MSSCAAEAPDRPPPLIARVLVIAVTPGQAADSPALGRCSPNCASPDVAPAVRAPARTPARGQGPQLTGHPRTPAGPIDHRGHPTAGRPDPPPQEPWQHRRRSTGLRRRGLQGPQRHRPRLQRPQATARTGRPVRQAGTDLPSRPRPRRHRVYPANAAGDLHRKSDSLRNSDSLALTSSDGCRLALIGTCARLRPAAGADAPDAPLPSRHGTFRTGISAVVVLSCATPRPGGGVGQAQRL